MRCRTLGKTSSRLSAPQKVEHIYFEVPWHALRSGKMRLKALWAPRHHPPRHRHQYASTPDPKWHDAHAAITAADTSFCCKACIATRGSEDLKRLVSRYGSRQLDGWPHRSSAWPANSQQRLTAVVAADDEEEYVPMAEFEARAQAAKLRPDPLKVAYLEKKGEQRSVPYCIVHHCPLLRPWRCG